MIWSERSNDLPVVTQLWSQHTVAGEDYLRQWGQGVCQPGKPKERLVGGPGSCKEEEAAMASAQLAQQGGVPRSVWLRSGIKGNSGAPEAAHGKIAQINN
jgi:hypothetical protein